MTSPTLWKIPRHPVADRPSWVNYAWSIGTTPIRNPILEHLALLFGIFVFCCYILKLRCKLFVLCFKLRNAGCRNRKLSREVSDLIAKTDQVVTENCRRAVFIDQLLDQDQRIQCHGEVLAFDSPNDPDDHAATSEAANPLDPTAAVVHPMVRKDGGE